MPKKPQYHHGDLKNALLLSALSLLEEDGLESLSLRKIAGRAGVSHAAPEHHFPTRKHLLTALATNGFHRFSKSMADEREKASHEPAEQMRAAMRGYLIYALDNAALFRLMFAFELLDCDDNELALAAQDGYRHLAEISAPAAQHLGRTEPDAIRKLEMMVWSHVHGYANLLIDNRLTHAMANPDDGLNGIEDLAALLFR